MNTIAFSDISVVVQGPIFEKTHLVLSSIRAQLPGATIILSTWKNSALSNLDYDILVENDDPGNHPYSWRPANNLKRQIVSTLSGLKHVKTLYTLKLRTDFVLTSSEFLNYFDRFPKRHDAYRIFEKRILNAPARYVGYLTRFSFNFTHRLLFHINDFIFFGLTTDLLKLWDIPFPPEPFFLYFNFGFGCQYCSEQYIWLACLRKYMMINYKDALDFSEETRQISDLSLVNNFVFLDVTMWSFYSVKYHFYSWFSRAVVFLATYSFYRWQVSYRRYCDAAFRTRLTRDFILNSLLYIPCTFFHFLLRIKSRFFRH